jgi:hypothetical protein
MVVHICEDGGNYPPIYNYWSAYAVQPDGSRRKIDFAACIGTEKLMRAMLKATRPTAEIIVDPSKVKENYG